MIKLSLKAHIVVFIDILGFSAMVTHDCEKPKGEQKYINSLFEIYGETKELGKGIDGLSVTQFSDSVVLAIPFSKDNFHLICQVVSNFQFKLLQLGILCRGGMSYGKHFSTQDFLFSLGLIEAYKLESKVALTPRIIVSQDLLDLIYKTNQAIPTEIIIKENDGLYFLCYMNGCSSNENKAAINRCIPQVLSKDSSIRSKQLWVIEYYNHKHPEDIFRDTKRFR